MPSQITRTHTQSSNIHSLAHILDSCAFIFSSCDLFTVYVTTLHPSPGDNHQTAGLYERTQGQAKMAAWNSICYICNWALHFFLPIAHCRAASTFIPLLPRRVSDHTSSLTSVYLVPVLHLFLPSTVQHPSGRTVLIHSFHLPKPSQCSLIRSTANSLSFPAVLRTSLFPTLAIRDIKKLLNIIKYYK